MVAVILKGQAYFPVGSMLEPISLVLVLWYIVLWCTGQRDSLSLAMKYPLSSENRQGGRLAPL